MGFFEPPPPPPEPPEQPPRPEWLGPPENVLPEPLALGLLVGRSDQAAIVLQWLLVFRRGFEVCFSAHTRYDQRDTYPFDPVPPRHRDPARLPDELLRVGVEYADGRRATSIGRRWRDAGDAPPELVLVPRGGGGGGRQWRHDFWVWPLPPPGPVTFAAEWPALGIAETRVVTDAAPIREAAARARELWPAEPRSSGAFAPVG